MDSIKFGSRERWLQISTVDMAQRKIASDRLMLVVFFLCITSIVLQAFLIFGSLNKLPGEVPLFYSRSWGEAMLAPTLGLWILPAVAFLTTAVNFLMAILWFSKNRFLARILVIFAGLVALMTLYDILKIIALLT